MHASKPKPIQMLEASFERLMEGSNIRLCVQEDTVRNQVLLHLSVPVSSSPSIAKIDPQNLFDNFSKELKSAKFFEDLSGQLGDELKKTKTKNEKLRQALDELTPFLDYFQLEYNLRHGKNMPGIPELRSRLTGSNDA